MSVHRRLIENQLAITPSMEAARMERDIVELASQARILGGMLPSLAEGDLSMESATLLELLGYSTEAEEKKSLLSRVWEHIKRIFAAIKEKIIRLFSMRKNYLEHNHFTAAKLRKYVDSIPATQTPEGKIKPRTTLLSPDPGKVKEEVRMYVHWAEKLVRDRERAIQDLSGIHFDLMDIKQIDEARGKALHYVEAANGAGAAMVNYTINRLKIDVNISGNDANDQMREATPASVVMMHTLLRQLDDLTKEDAKLNEELKKSLDTAKKFQTSVDAFVKKAYAEHNGKVFDHKLDEMMDYNKMRDSLKGVNKLADDIVALLRLSHYRVLGDVSNDILEIVRKSLGAYKFKKHELMPEDRPGAKKDGDHEYR